MSFSATLPIGSIPSTPGVGYSFPPAGSTLAPLRSFLGASGHFRGRTGLSALTKMPWGQRLAFGALPQTPKTKMRKHFCSASIPCAGQKPPSVAVFGLGFCRRQNPSIRRRRIAGGPRRCLAPPGWGVGRDPQGGVRTKGGPERMRGYALIDRGSGPPLPVVPVEYASLRCLKRSQCLYWTHDSCR
jgi:hypothetical protein